MHEKNINFNERLYCEFHIKIVYSSPLISLHLVYPSLLFYILIYMSLRWEILWNFFAWLHHYMNMTLILNLASNRCVPFFNRRKALFQKNSQATVCACAYTLNNIDVRPSIGIFHYLLPKHHIYVSRSYLKDRIYITWTSKKMLFFWETPILSFLARAGACT